MKVHREWRLACSTLQTCVMHDTWSRPCGAPVRKLLLLFPSCGALHNFAPFKNRKYGARPEILHPRRLHNPTARGCLQAAAHSQGEGRLDAPPIGLEGAQEKVQEYLSRGTRCHGGLGQGSTKALVSALEDTIGTASAGLSYVEAVECVIGQPQGPTHTITSILTQRCGQCLSSTAGRQGP